MSDPHAPVPPPYTAGRHRDAVRYGFDRIGSAADRTAIRAGRFFCDCAWGSGAHPDGCPEHGDAGVPVVDPDRMPRPAWLLPGLADEAIGRAWGETNGRRPDNDLGRSWRPVRWTSVDWVGGPTDSCALPKTVFDALSSGPSFLGRLFNTEAEAYAAVGGVLRAVLTDIGLPPTPWPPAGAAT